MDTMDKNNPKAVFEHQIVRYETTGDIHKAFVLCLQKLSDMDVKESATVKIRELVNKHSYKVFEPYGEDYRLQIDFLLDADWLLDIAISLGYKEVRHTKISTGLFSSVPGIAIGSLLKRHRYGLLRNMKNNTTIIYYTLRCFCDDFKMITAICEKLVELYSFRSDKNESIKNESHIV